MATDTVQFGRKVSLVLVDGEKGLELSDFRFAFKTAQQDVESPANCSIRVYNLSEATIKKVRGEFSRVVLQAGYESSYGVIFDGSIKQFRIGRENATDTYLDILAADGDKAYNFSTINRTLAAGSSPQDRVQAAIEAMNINGVSQGHLMPFTGGILPRGKVLFGMARATLRQETQSQGASWTISGGKVNIVPLDGYLPGEAVVLNAKTGMVGIPEQTIDGIRVRCLLNPKLVVGGLVQIDNRSINQTVQQNPQGAPIPYNQYTGLQLLATTTNDGLYRLFVVEHSGDTRGNDWYSDLICLAINADTKKVRIE